MGLSSFLPRKKRLTEETSKRKTSRRLLPQLQRRQPQHSSCGPAFPGSAPEIRLPIPRPIPPNGQQHSTSVSISLAVWRKPPAAPVYPNREKSNNTGGHNAQCWHVSAITPLLDAALSWVNHCRPMQPASMTPFQRPLRCGAVGDVLGGRCTDPSNVQVGCFASSMLRSRAFKTGPPF